MRLDFHKFFTIRIIRKHISILLLQGLSLNQLRSRKGDMKIIEVIEKLVKDTKRVRKPKDQDEEKQAKLR